MYITGSSFYVSTLLFGSPEKIFVQKKKKEGKEKEKKKRRSEKQIYGGVVDQGKRAEFIYHCNPQSPSHCRRL